MSEEWNINEEIMDCGNANTVYSTLEFENTLRKNKGHPIRCQSHKRSDLKTILFLKNNFNSMSNWNFRFNDEHSMRGMVRGVESEESRIGFSPAKRLLFRQRSKCHLSFYTTKYSPMLNFQIRLGNIIFYSIGAKEQDSG